MNFRQFTRRLCLITAAVGATAVTAQAQLCPPGSTQSTVTYQGVFPDPAVLPEGFSGGFANEPVSVPQWNPANFPPGSVLKGARITATLICTSEGQVTNNSSPGSIPCGGTWTGIQSATFHQNPMLMIPPAGDRDFNDCDSSVSIGLNPPLDPPLAPGDSRIVTPVSSSETLGPFSEFDAADLANKYTGAGNLTFLFSGLPSPANGCNFPCGTFDCAVELKVKIVVDIEYTYCTQGPPPSGCCDFPSQNFRRPGSLLLYPEFNNGPGAITVLTLTNSKCAGLLTDVNAHVVYIDGDTCQEDDFDFDLTACDTITWITNAHNPNPERGYVYVYATNDAGEPIVWNHFIGSSLVISGFDNFNYQINPLVLRGIGSGAGVELADGSPTDLDGDGIRDLDGAEYSMTPDSITIPRFLGQSAPGQGGFRGALVLVALSGGTQFDTKLDFTIFNDNEEAFSSEWTFHCWDRVDLTTIDAAFTNAFLKTTNHDPAEIIGAPTRESGWICIDGASASSSAEDIDDPAFYAFYVERSGVFTVADLPFECGSQANGSLLPRDLLGDGDPTPQDGDNQ